MYKLFYKAIIKDVKNIKCTDAEIDALIDMFKYIMKHSSIAGLRKANFDLKELSMTQRDGINNFNLLLTHKKIEKTHHFSGTFKYGDKKLKVTGFLEKD